MSVNISISRIDKVGADALLGSILNGSFQADARKRIPELFKELEKYPAVTDEEVYAPEYNTPEARVVMGERGTRRAEIHKELRKYGWLPGHIDEANKLRNSPENEDYFDWVNAIVGDVVGLNSDSFFSPLWDVQVCIDLLFKHAGYKPEETESLEKVSFDTWNAVFNDLNKELLAKVKGETDRHPDEYGSFDDFLEVTKEIRRIQKQCDGVNTLFSVDVEGDGNKHYEESLAEKIKAHLKEKAIEPVDLQGYTINPYDLRD
jgi:hypothetical protein